MISLCNDFDNLLGHHCSNHARAWVKLKSKHPVDISYDLLITLLIRLECIVAFGDENFVKTFLGLIEIFGGLSLFQVLADEGPLLPSEGSRLVKESAEEFIYRDTITDSFDEKLVLLVRIAAGVLVFKDRTDISKGEAVQSRRVDTVEGCRTFCQGSHLFVQLLGCVPRLESTDNS